MAHLATAAGTSAVAVYPMFWYDLNSQYEGIAAIGFLLLSFAGAVCVKIIASCCFIEKSLESPCNFILSGIALASWMYCMMWTVAQLENTLDLGSWSVMTTGMVIALAIHVSFAPP